MKPAAAFLFFLLFLAGIALVNLRSMQPDPQSTVPEQAQLAGTTWRSTHLGEMRMDEDTPAFIHFGSDGTLSGNAGCNRFSGSWVLAAAALDLGELGVTRTACPEPANSLEIAFLEQIATVRSAARSETRLVLRNEAGQPVMRFAIESRPTEPGE